MNDRVAKFRGIVDETIASNVRKIERGPWRPISLLDYRQVAEFGGLAFASTYSPNPLPSFFGLDHAHIWGIGSTGFTVLNGPASMAVVSVEGYEEGLIRRVSVDSHFAGITADTERRLETAEELDDALRWASRPHMAYDEMARLAILMPSEVEMVQEELASLEQGMRQLVNELAEIDEALF